MKQPDKNFDIGGLLQIAIHASVAAGRAIMSLYDSKYPIELKPDESPLTLADKNAHKVIHDFLKKTNIAVLSEEGKNIPYLFRKDLPLMWIVDPLDGTKEFIKHNDEFTVNIALVKENAPILGVVYCPPLKTIYYAAIGKGAFKSILSDQPFSNFFELFQEDRKLPFPKIISNFVVVASRSHMNEETTAFISNLTKTRGEIQLTTIGSSLKFCLVAEGSADIYPRFAPTFEWDTAAAQAIVECSGAEVINPFTASPLTYNKENLLNPWFIAKRK